MEQGRTVLVRANQRGLVGAQAEVPSPLSAKQIVQRHTLGTYTTARTLGYTAVIDHAQHVDRICAVERSWAGHPPPSSSAGVMLVDVALIRATLQAALQRGLTAFHTTPPTHEARITMAISLRETQEQGQEQDQDAAATLGFDLDVFVEALPPVPAAPVAVDVYTAERTNPSIKHTQWAVDRAPLEAKMSPDANEVVMQDSHGRLYEGLSSNFFVLDARDGKIHTAPETLVLAGTIRRIVRSCVSLTHSLTYSFTHSIFMTQILQVCAALNVEISFELPVISDAPHWAGAFISSTSRLLLPIDTFHVHEPRCQEIHIQNSPLIELLRQAVVTHLSQDASPVL